MHFNTKAVHEGQAPDEKTGAVIPPIYQTTTFRQDAPGEHRGHEYTRAGNPNFENLETNLASLEGGKFCTVMSSGLGATLSLLTRLKGGDHVVAVDDVYGGTYRILAHLSKQFQMGVTYVSGNDPREWEEASTAKTRYFWLESPTNPLLHVVDIDAISKIAKRKGIATVVDNTFASPFLQNPLELGADVVLHSTTKYIGGHSDVIGGAVITNDRGIADDIFWARMAYGVNPSPFDTWLAMRGVKTLGLRMQQHVKNAQRVAEFLQGHRKVEEVFYPGLPSHAGHVIAKKQMKHGFGGMVTARFACKPDALGKALAGFRLFTLAESLGGVESLVCHPATMTHASVPKETREARGITDTVARFSVGIEDGDDLLADLEEGLGKLS